MPETKSHDPSPVDAATARVPRSVLRLLMALGSLCLLLVLWILVVEVGLRFIPVPGYTRADLVPIPLDDADARNEGHPYLAYALRKNWSTPPGAKHQATHNALGFRGPETTWEKPKGTTRVLCLGGSSTYGHTESSDATTWPVRLQERLNAALPGRTIEVINGGCSGYSTFENLVNLSFRGVDLEPDLVIIYHSINDNRCALYYWPDRPVQHDNSHWRAVWPVYRESPVERYLEKSMTYLIWRRYFTDYFQKRADLNFAAMVGFDPKATNYYTIQDPTKRGYQNSYRNFRSMIAVARQFGAKVLLSTQGLDDQDLKGRASMRNELEGMEQMRKIIYRVAEEMDVPVVDAEKVLEDEAAKQRAETGNQKIFSHEVHLFDDGADLLAKTFCEFIVREKLLDPAKN